MADLAANDVTVLEANTLTATIAALTHLMAIYSADRDRVQEILRQAASEYGAKKAFEVSSIADLEVICEALKLFAHDKRALDFRLRPSVAVLLIASDFGNMLPANNHHLQVVIGGIEDKLTAVYAEAALRSQASA